MSLSDRGQRALEQARGVLQLGDAASSEAKNAAKEELWSIVSIIEQQQKAGFAHAEEEMAIRNLKGQLLKKIGELMDARP
jgi:exonuclease VII small subunit